MKAVVTGMIATYPLGGVAWDYGQYVLGLEQLGVEVTYLEDPSIPFYDPTSKGYEPDPNYGFAFLERSLRELGAAAASRWHVRAVDGSTAGLTTDEIETAIAEADLFLNVSGAAVVRPRYRQLARRMALIDTDPGWNHFFEYAKWDRGERWKNDPSILGYRDHDVFFTYASRLGRDGCRLPDLGLDWWPTRPPVVLDRWRRQPPGERWTTIMTWDNFRRPIEYGGRTYGSKELEFPQIESLPQRTKAPLEVAVAGGGAPVEQWRLHGWTVVNAEDVSRTLDRYREYVQGSRAEFSVAKNVYVDTKSGWFSCRSVCYLAAGRPVVVQDTGFTDVIEAGCGVVPWSTPSEALAGIEAVELAYEEHSRAAREIAAAEFDARAVLADLLDRAGAGG